MLLAVTSLVTVGGAAPASAATTTFTTAGEHSYTVPAGVTRIRVIAMGGNGLFADVGFGFGALAQADIPVTPGSTLYAVVGGNGGQSAAGFNGGGGTINAGGGGGGTDLRTCTIAAGQPNTCDPADLGTPNDPRSIVAAGGGGTSRIAGTIGASNVGSPGGTPDAGPGGNGVGPEPGGGGQGGTQTGGGAGGTGPLPGEEGTAGQGGMGGSSAAGGDGGGGGGGTAAAGSGGGGGGGGSSYIVDGSTNGSYRQKSPSEVSSITIITPIPQQIAFTSDPPEPAVVGGSYQATATGGGSSAPVVFSADAASTPGACTVSAGGDVGFTGVGTCVVDADQGGDNNYEAAAEAQQSITVTPAVLVVTAPSPSRVYGAANPALPPSYSGFVNGDSEGSLVSPAVCSTSATAASDAGSYPVTCSGASSPNYAVSYVDGTLTVTPAPTTASSLLSTLLRPTATLVRSDTGAPVVGQSVAFSVDGQGGCAATTNGNGVARCSTIVVSLTDFDAVFGGSQNYAASNVAHGDLL